MGSLDPGSLPLKRHLSSAPGGGAGGTVSRAASSSPGASAKRLLLRFLLFEKVDYLQWIGTAAAFFFVVLLFHSLLGPPIHSSVSDAGGNERPMLSPVFVGLEFGDGLEIVPNRLMEKWRLERLEESNAVKRLSRAVVRSGVRKPRVAMVFADLGVNAMQVQMVSIAMAAMAVGYQIEVYSFEEGPTDRIWSSIGAVVHILNFHSKLKTSVDWLNYECVIVNSLEAGTVLLSLLQEPFKSVPVIWTINDNSLEFLVNQYNSSGKVQSIDVWNQVFNRATVVVFQDYILPVIYATFDSGNYFVIPGSPAEAVRADMYFSMISNHSASISNGSGQEKISIAIVGTQFSYSGKLLEHVLILEALQPLLDLPSSKNRGSSWLKIRFLSRKSAFMKNMAIETLALKAGFPEGVVESVVVDEDMCSFLGTADVVIYGSFLEERSFPSVLLQAMSLQKLIVAPDIKIIRKYVNDSVNGYLFPKNNTGILSKVVLEALSNGKLSAQGENVAFTAMTYAKNLLATENIEGYVSLLENVVKLPSEVSSPGSVKDIPGFLKEQWQWGLFENVSFSHYVNRSSKCYMYFQKIDEIWLRSHQETSQNSNAKSEEAFSITSWEEEKSNERVNARKRLEEEELKSRSDLPHGTWEEFYRSVKRADRVKNELHEREDMELERMGQPLCIYEPFLGDGVWPFLHRSSLYRGIALSSKGRRPGTDDIDASSRLPLLSNVYYRDLLGEFGALFSLANQIDRIHKNGWIGFQSWRATAEKADLSRHAESTILEAIQAKSHGDAMYFWLRMDQDHRNAGQQDFWSFCDAINAGNCRFTYMQALAKMYGVQNSSISLPLMPNLGGTWSVMQSWILPTRSFQEFIMFSRMFVDALDAETYNEHHQSGFCFLSLNRDKQCFVRILEHLVNVWAYHSARRMIYVNPQSGEMEEQHPLLGRRSQMWIGWFSYSTLKAMDEDLAEEYDTDRPNRRWLWPYTGEVFWQGVYERERNMRHQQKELRKQQSRDKIQRIKKRARQKTLGKFIRPSPEDGEGSSGAPNNNTRL